MNCLLPDGNRGAGGLLANAATLSYLEHGKVGSAHVPILQRCFQIFHGLLSGLVGELKGSKVHAYTAFAAQVDMCLHRFCGVDVHIAPMGKRARVNGP